MNINVFNLKINDVLTTLKGSLLQSYRKGDIDDLFNYFDEQKAISTLNVDCPEMDINLDLDTGLDNPHDTDYENVKRLYERLKDLPPNIAAKPEFWGCYAHAYHADYVVYRSEVERENYTEQTVLRDFFCRSGKEQPRRMLVVNLLSRLWWTGRLMYDDENEDPYHFVRHFTNSAYNSKIVLFASSTAASNHEVAMGMMDAIDFFKIERGMVDITRREILACTKFLNSIGAVRMIDTLSRQEIRNICLNRMNAIL